MSRGRVLAAVAKDVCTRMGRTKRMPGAADDPASAPAASATPLRRCLSTLDVTLLGVGHMVGAGVYVLAGGVARDVAGPAAVLSFLLAGAVSLLSALCYAELGARLPRAGSAYAYAYVSVGEFFAFVVGWNVILEHMIGAASVARAWSGALDAWTGGAVANWTAKALGSSAAHPSAPPDALAALVTVLCTLALAAGAKVSARVNAAFTVVNVLVIALVVGVACWGGSLDNWSGPGGFLPFGFGGVLAGAASAFYAFVGFDSIACAGEEALRPAWSIPLAVGLSLLVATALYAAAAAALTLLVPWRGLPAAAGAALPDAVGAVAGAWAGHAVAAGALAGMTTSLLGALFALPRTVYAMAADGLLCNRLGKVCGTTQVPLLALALGGGCSALLALLVELSVLVEWMSIGTLLAYSVVCAAVVVLRYRPPPAAAAAPSHHHDDDASSSQSALSEGEGDAGSADEVSLDGGGVGRLKRGRWRWLRAVGVGGGGARPGAAPAAAVAVFAPLSFFFCAAVGVCAPALAQGSLWPLPLLAALALAMIFCVVVMWGHVQAARGPHFHVPCVPLLPALSILCNAALLAHLPALSWARFVVWMALGLLVYFVYGIRHSREGEGAAGASGAYSVLLASPEADKGAWGAVQPTPPASAPATAPTPSDEDDDEPPLE